MAFIKELFEKAKDAGLNDEWANLVANGDISLDDALGDMDVDAESAFIQQNIGEIYQTIKDELIAIGFKGDMAAMLDAMDDSIYGINQDGYAFMEKHEMLKAIKRDALEFKNANENAEDWE